MEKYYLMFIFICLVLKPTKGMTLTGQIYMIFRHGIFANIDKIKILIPESKLNKWTFEKRSIY